MNTTIPWYQSAIIRQQIVAFLVAGLGLLGITTDIDIEGTVSAILAGIGAVIPVYTIITRLLKPSPNITVTADRKEKALVEQGKIPKQGGFARVSMLTFVAVMAALTMSMLQGCTTNAAKPQDVISLACSPSDAYLIERCAEAVGDVYGVFQERALNIVRDPATPSNVKSALQKLDIELTPAVRMLVQTSLAYIHLRDLQDPNAGAKRAELALQLADVQPKVQTLPKL
jgi:hypothetical protein